jgi:hypothetical protein
MGRHFFAALAFSDLACNHRNRSYYGKKRIKTADPADRFQVFIVLTIRVL